MPIIYDAQIEMKYGTEAEWTASNYVLAAGEEGYESDTKKRKVGDGSTAWNSLAYDTGGSGYSPDRGSVSEVAGACTLNAKDIIKITTAGTAILAGQTFDITLTADRILTNSSLTGTIENGTNNQGLPIVQAIQRSVGSCVIKILNLGAQSDSLDTNGTLIITITII